MSMHIYHGLHGMTVAVQYNVNALLMAPGWRSDSYCCRLVGLQRGVGRRDGAMLNKELCKLHMTIL
jgi:hypothetical protein